MKQRLILISLALLTVGSFWLMRDLEKTLTPVTGEPTAREVIVAYGVDGRYYHADNSLQYALKSDTMTEMSHHAGTHLTRPRIHVWDSSRRLALTGTAEKAHLSGDKVWLSLNGDVHLTESPRAEKPIHARSETMVYNAQERRVSGNLPITVSSDKTQQTAATFWFDIPTRIMSLQGDVKARYQPPATTTQ